MADPLSDALGAIATLLANTPEFQTFANVDNADDATGHIFLGGIGTPVASIAVAAGVMTIKLREPFGPLTVGGKIALDGAMIGPQGNKLTGTFEILGFEILALGDVQMIPWTDSGGNIWTDLDGNPWEYASDEVLTLTVKTDAPDVAEFLVDGVVMLPCARPYALVVRGDNNALKTKSIATGGMVIASGEADILLEARVASGYRNNEIRAVAQANAAFGSLISGLAALAGTDDFILLNEITPIAPEFIAIEEQNSNAGRYERWTACIHVTWGLEG